MTRNNGVDKRHCKRGPVNNDSVLVVVRPVLTTDDKK